MKALNVNGFGVVVTEIAATLPGLVAAKSIERVYRNLWGWHKNPTKDVENWSRYAPWQA